MQEQKRAKRETGCAGLDRDVSEDRDVYPLAFILRDLRIVCLLGEGFYLDVTAGAPFAQEIQQLCCCVLVTADSELLERGRPSMEALWSFGRRQVDAEQKCWVADAGGTI